MAKFGTVSFTGKTNSYSFNAYNIPQEVPEEGGIYIFGIHNVNANTITPVYIGMAQSFQDRFYNHHKKDCITKAGANCICLMNVKDEKQRTIIEKDLLAGYATKCNEVLNPVTPK